MDITQSRKPKQVNKWPHTVFCGRESVTIYRRKTPLGNFAFMVANYSVTKRRFDSYKTENKALEAANKLAKQLSQRDTISASMTREQSIEYASAIQSLQPLGITLTATVAAVVEAVKLTGDLAGLAAAARFYKAKHRQVTPKRVADVVAELLAVKQSRDAAERYLDDLRFRLKKFAEKFPCSIATVQTSDIQTWLDDLKLSSQSYANNRRVVHLLFEFAVARGYALDNPAAKVERPKTRNGEIQVFTPDETSKLLEKATVDFLPCLALGLFAGLRSAEIERVTWEDVDLKQGHIVVGADAAKTASRRIVPIADNLAEWLKPYADHKGRVWAHGRDWFHKCQLATAKAAGVNWKSNACRHSYASYMFAGCSDAGRVAGYCGNSPGVIHRHYKQLCTTADAVKFFSIKPASSANDQPLVMTANQ